jgi:DNA-binding transcriptional LysR family regulator
MVEAGMGTTLLPQLAADDLTAHHRKVTIKPMVRPIPSRRIGVVWRANAAVSEDVEAFAAFGRGHLPAGVGAIS